MRAHGFKVMYERVNCPNGTYEASIICSSYCSQSYYAKNGTVTLPISLRKSLGRINCAFGIIQAPGSYIKIKEINMTVPCQNAFLEIRDGAYEDSPLMARFCDDNDNVPAHFQSSQNQVFIRWENHSICTLIIMT